MENIVVSVIIPVYNGEQTLPRLMDSVLSQTLADIEVIAVNDGSSDQTGAILDRYALADARVTAVHKKNGGAPAARNEAMRIARGKYLFFADADDWLEDAMLEKMAALCEEHALELAICGFYTRTATSADKEHILTRSPDERIYKTRDMFRGDAYRLFDKNLLYPPWNKLYLASYVKSRSCTFPNTYWDDFPFNLSVLRDVSRVGTLDAPLYHFTRSREDSETAKYREDLYEKREEVLRWMLDLYDHWNLSDENSMEMIYRRYIERVIGCIENAASRESGLSVREKIRKIRSILANEQVSKALKYARPRSAYMKLMLVPLRMRSAYLCYLEGLTITRVKSANARLFTALKANR